MENFFHLAIYFNNRPNTSCVAYTDFSNLRNVKVGDQATSEKIAGARPAWTLPRFRHPCSILYFRSFPTAFSH